ncbi:MAG: serine/threonine-protein phosphatase [Saprospiraceae bacterium]|nr:serine/threonine-protein phosphatase [Saprospiraceae bacterium]
MKGLLKFILLRTFGPNMPELQEIRSTLSRIDRLEREIGLKQLQINSLLTITQAINENVPAEDLFKMYGAFLRFEMAIRKMALFFRENQIWECKISSGVDETLFQPDISSDLSRFRSTQGLSDDSHPLFREFDLVIPIMHKNTAIAYAFLGGFRDEDDVYSKVQFVTTITNIIAVAIENKRLFKSQVQQQIVNREVELAAEIQRALVPGRMPSSKGYQLSGIYRPHFRALVSRRPALEELVREMNEAVFRVTQGDKFITFFVARYDTAARTLHYVNAGHIPPFMIMNGVITTLRNGATSLGWLPKLPFLEIGEVKISAPALIFTFTDGLTEARNSHGDEFGEERLAAFLKEHENDDPETLNSRLIQHVELFRGREPWPDDITLLTCKLF